MSRIRLWLVMMIVGALSPWGRAADNPCLPSGPPDTNCLWQALVKVLPNMTIDPAVQATNRPFDSITCVGLPIKASGPAYGLVTNGCQVIFRPQEPARCGDLILGTTYPVPTGVTWNWTIADDGTESGQGDEVEFTRTNATAGSVAFEINQVLMPPDSKCPGAVHPDYETVGRSFAFVAVDSLAPPEGTPEIDDGDNDPNTRTFVVCTADSGVLPIYAVPNPSLAEEYLPQCWNLTGGQGIQIVSKTEARISLTDPGEFTVTCNGGTSTKTTKVTVLRVSLLSVDASDPHNAIVSCRVEPAGISVLALFEAPGKTDEKTASGNFTFTFDQEDVVLDGGELWLTVFRGNANCTTFASITRVDRVVTSSMELVGAYFLVEGVGLRLYPHKHNEDYRKLMYSIPYSGKTIKLHNSAAGLQLGDDPVLWGEVHRFSFQTDWTAYGPDQGSISGPDGKWRHLAHGIWAEPAGLMGFSKVSSLIWSEAGSNTPGVLANTEVEVAIE